MGAIFSCAPEFEKVGGTDERTCSSSGSWSGEAPVCAIDVAAGKPAFQVLHPILKYHYTFVLINSPLEVPLQTSIEKKMNFSHLVARSTRFPEEFAQSPTIRLDLGGEEVDLLSSYSVHGVAIRLGKQSSPILNVYLIQQNGDLRLMCECMAYLGGSSVTFQLCDISGYAFFENTTVYVHCELADVEK
ncbi:hypothetical protein OSTOST_18352, partial [Ostertagia ostertagi]